MNTLAVNHTPTLTTALDEEQAAARRRAMAAHPTSRRRPAPVRLLPAEDGSMTTEYGLIVVVGATCTSLVIKWASGGAVFELLGKVLNAAGRLVGLS